MAAPVLPPGATEATVEETAKLKKHFGRFDIFCFLLCTIVGIDTISSVATNGGQALTWMIILALVFFVPQALLFAELGTAFPNEGGPYIWTRLAFGHLVGAVNNFLYWITNPVWLGGSLVIGATTAYSVFFDSGRTLGNVGFYIFGLIFIWVGVLAAILSFGVGKWLPTAGAFARVILLAFFSLTVIIYAIDHGVHGLGAGSFKPSYTGLILLVGVLMFNYVGFELPNTAGDEMTNPKRDVPIGIARSTVASFLLYAIPILGIIVVLPTNDISNFGGFQDAVKTVFTVYGGHLAKSGPVLSGAGTVLGDFCGILIILALLTSGITWIMGSDRALAVSGYDGAAPRSLGVFNARFGTPVRVNFCSGVVATVTMIGAHQLTHGNSAKDFSAVLGITISTTLVSYLGIFPALWWLRKKYPDVPRPFKAPAAGLISAFLTLLVIFATIQLLMPGIGKAWFGPGFALSQWKGQRVGYLFSQLIPLVVFVLIGVAFWMAGKKTREKLVDLVALEADQDRAKAAAEAAVSTTGL
jgi:amino acid transporter